jgi:hypothetical protein
MPALIVFGERTRRRYVRHVGGLQARSFRPLITRAGFVAQASKRSQSFAGITTILRSNTSNSAASRALRRTKSLRFVRDCDEAASKSARSWLLNRTLNTDVDMAMSLSCAPAALSPNSSREIHRLLFFLAKRRPMPAISSWRGKAGIDPTVIARALWLQTHPLQTGLTHLPVNVAEKLAGAAVAMLSCAGDRFSRSASPTAFWLRQRDARHVSTASSIISAWRLAADRRQASPGS